MFPQMIGARGCWIDAGVMDFRLPNQTLYYNFDHEYPTWAQV